MNNNESNNINVQLTTVNEPTNIKEIISSWLDIGFKLGIALGALISWIFFSFFVNALPSLGNLGDIAIYLISISAWSLIISGYIIATSFASSFIIKSTSEFNDDTKTSLAWYYVIFTVISTLTLLLLKICESPQFVWNILITLLFLFFPLLYSGFILSPAPTKTVINTIFDIGFPLIIFSLIILLEALMIDKIYDDWNEQLWIYFLWIVVIVVLNSSIIKDQIANWNTALFIVIGYLGIIAMGFIVLEIDNPIIVKPFKQLKLGHYKTELHFKDDFINKSNPFSLNETNQTSNVFFVLSSVGDEYIIKEIKYAQHKADDNLTHNHLMPFTYCNALYYCEDENFSKIWKLNDKDQLIRLKNVPLDFNLSIKKEFKRWKQWKEPIYRIKKENIEFEITGKDFESRSTIWNYRPIKEPKPSKYKTKENPKKLTKQCTPNITQTCYCSYTNNQPLQMSQP